MRYPEDKIKDVILHHDPELRLRALHYFSRSYSQDPTVMTQVITAVETYDREDAYDLIGESSDLPQTEASIAWVIGELNGDQCGTDRPYADALSAILLNADLALLEPRAKDLGKLRHASDGLHTGLGERWQMRSWDESACWERLEAFCKAAAEDQDADPNLDHAERVVEALARHGRSCEARTLALLEQKRDAENRFFKEWLDPYLARLAGRARYESAVPLLVDALHIEQIDLQIEESIEALIRLGTPSVVEALDAQYPKAQERFRLFASDVLGHIHSDLAVATCLEWLGREKNRDVQNFLVEALLSQFADEGVEAARQRLARSGTLSFEERGIRRTLLDNCAISGARFPEYDAWLAAHHSDSERRKMRFHELEDDPEGQTLLALESLIGQKPGALAVETPPPEKIPLVSPISNQGRTKVGRNDPCPCGSGKKFKKCCGRNMP